jgi:hypothetical protein
VAADPVGLSRRCPPSPRSAWFKQCPFSLLRSTPLLVYSDRGWLTCCWSATVPAFRALAPLLARRGAGMTGTSTEGSIEDVGVAISFVDDQVVFAVRGRLDLFRAPDVRAILETVVDRGHHSVVLDLAQNGVHRRDWPTGDY